MARMFQPRWLALALTASAVIVTSSVARADERERCIAAAEKSQSLKNAGKLSDAKAELAICQRNICPRLIAQDCTQWMGEVLQALPTIVPGAKDRRGRDLVDVTVAIDGKVVTQNIDGKPIEIDPGVHVLRFEGKGAPPVEEQVVIRQNEKDRILTVHLAIGDEPASAPPALAPAATATPPLVAPVTATSDVGSNRGSGAPIAAYVVGGLGIAAAAAGLYMNLAASSDARELRDTCAPRCNQADVDAIDTRYTIAGVTMAVGGAAVVAGVVLFLTHRFSASPPSGSALTTGTFRF